MIKTCQHCGQSFEAYVHNAKYCIDCRYEVARTRARHYEKSHVLKRREINHRWYVKNREQRLEYFRRRYIKSKLAVLRGGTP